jgi:hypothetical protein
VRDRPDVVLTQHFFSSLFDFGILSDEGTDSFKRALLGASAVAIGLGLLLVRIFMAKYGDLLAEGSVEAYQRAVVADHAFIVALIMWIVAVACGLAGQSLFPGELDYRILMAEPLSRRTIFGAKLAALLLYSGLFVVGAHVALLPLVALTLVVAAMTDSLIATASAFAVASLAASLFAVLAIVAVQGLLVMLAPRARLVTFSTAARSAVVWLLVLSLPFLVRLPAAASAFASDAWWLHWAPPAWFVGLGRWMTGDAARGTLAVEAVTAMMVVLTISIWSYVLLYRRFDRVALHPGDSQPGQSSDRSGPRLPRMSVRLAIDRFVSITLRRSVVHQSILVALLAAAGGFVLNGLLAADIWQVVSGTRANAAARPILIWAPMTLMFLAAPGVRLTLSIPLDLRANWIFRVTEDGATRGEVIAAGVRTVFVMGVVLPTALIAPLQWWVLGSQTLVLVPVEWLIGWLLVEWLMVEWRRIPFTCSYIPGKGFVPHVFVKAVGSYMLFTLVAGGLLRVSLASTRALSVIVLILAVPAALLCRRRTRQARIVDLTFEDELPSDVTPLHLNAD